MTAAIAVRPKRVEPRATSYAETDTRGACPEAERGNAVEVAISWIAVPAVTLVTPAGPDSGNKIPARRAPRCLSQRHRNRGAARSPTQCRTKYFGVPGSTTTWLSHVFNPLMWELVSVHRLSIA